MIKTVTITNHLGESLELELGKPDKTGIYIEKIDGLGPVNAQINMTELSSNDGSVYNSARLRSRNIVFTFGLMFNPMVEDMRHLLYRMFPLKKPVRIDVVTDRRAVYALGYTEKNDPDIFNQKETQQVSVLCPQPWLFDQDYSEADFFYADKAFEFPFWNPKADLYSAEKTYAVGDWMSDDGDIIYECNTDISAPEQLDYDHWDLLDPDDILHTKTIMFGNITRFDNVSFYYVGDNETGMVINVHIVNEIVYSGASSLIGFRIYNDNSEMIIVDFRKFPSSLGGHLLSGDDIQISTVKGNKYAVVIRNGSEKNVINSLGRPTDWMQILPGDNTFNMQIYIPSGVTSTASDMELSISYRTQYEGV